VTDLLLHDLPTALVPFVASCGVLAADDAVEVIFVQFG
jgi:hypothetical protein